MVWIPSFADIEAIHDVVVETPPGVLAAGFRERASDGVQGETILHEILDAAATAQNLDEALGILVSGMCLDQPFRDGNKRTAFVTLDAVLAQYGRWRTIEDEALERILVGAQQGFEGPSSLAEWAKINYV